jgi:hypothetical protein
MFGLKKEFQYKKGRLAKQGGQFFYTILLDKT